MIQFSSPIPTFIILQVLQIYNESGFESAFNMLTLTMLVRLINLNMISAIVDIKKSKMVPLINQELRPAIVTCKGQKSDLLLMFKFMFSI